jgi:hypothetical protein
VYFCLNELAARRTSANEERSAMIRSTRSFPLASLICAWVASPFARLRQDHHDGRAQLSQFPGRFLANSSAGARYQANFSLHSACCHDLYLLSDNFDEIVLFIEKAMCSFPLDKVSIDV